RTALGIELGEEKVKFWREPSVVTPTFVLTKPFSRQLKAAFAEASVPLLSQKQHIPLVHLIEIGGAIRATDYSDAGGVTTATYRGLFQPVKWLTLRTSRSEGFKPVRLYDLQAPVTNFTSTYTSTSNIRDPLRGNELVLGTFTYRSGGNPNLKSENSVSKNAGIVLDVPGRWFKGLSFSADYYQIYYFDRSGSTSLQNLMAYFPERVTRAAPTASDTAAGYAGLVTTWDASNINLAWVKTKGWDYRATYSRTFGFGELVASVAFTDPNVILTRSTPAAAPSSAFGNQPSRLSASLFWSRGAWDAGLVVNRQHRYFIAGLNNTNFAYPEYTEYNPQVSYNSSRDPRFSRNAGDWWARYLAGTKVTLTIINALKAEPDLVDAANSRFTGDPRLRRYIVSLAKKF
ncbi:MAG: TonB-dependent receptor, partial [Lacunisphaera sp.]|nr:TonB-dependent receptor [Lacunisphaera sp.]